MSLGLVSRLVFFILLLRWNWTDVAYMFATLISHCEHVVKQFLQKFDSVRSVAKNSDRQRYVHMDLQ